MRAGRAGGPRAVRRTALLLPHGMDSRLLPSRLAHDTAGRHEENTAGVTFALRPYRVAGCRFDAVVLGGAAEKRSGS